MNEIIREGAATAQYGWLAGAMTIVFMTSFVGWAWWAYAPSRRAELDAAARMPLDDGGEA